MTGAVLSYQKETVDTVELRFKRKGIDIFSKRLSEFTGLDFTKIVDNFNDELKGLLSYLRVRRSELEAIGLSKDDVSIFLTLNMISSFSLWLGFNRGQEYLKSAKEDLENRLKERVSSKISISEIRSNYKSGVIIPTNLTNLDDKKLIQLKNLVMSLNSWGNLSGLWIIGGIQDQASKILSELDNVKVINVNEDNGPAKARNIGIEKALAADMDLLVFMDDDVVSPVNETFKLVCNNAVKGRDIYSPKIESYLSTCYDLFHDLDGTLNGVYEPDTEYKSLVYGTTCVMIAPVFIFDDGLRFDENFPLAAGEDIDFCIRARAKGHMIVPADDLVVKHNYGYDETKDSLKKFVSRFVRYGEGNRLIKTRQPQYFDTLTYSIRRPTQNRQKKATIFPTPIKILSNIFARCLE
jgi:GT2 family glycosyltransferase